MRVLLLSCLHLADLIIFVLWHFCVVSTCWPLLSIILFMYKLQNILLIFLPEIPQCDFTCFRLESKILNPLRSGKVHTMLLKFMLLSGQVKAPFTSWDNMQSSSVLKYEQKCNQINDMNNNMAFG